MAGEQSSTPWSTVSDDVLSSDGSIPADKLLISTSGTPMGLSFGDNTYYQLAQLGFGQFFQPVSNIYDHLSPTDIVNASSLQSHPQVVSVLNIPGYDSTDFQHSTNFVSSDMAGRLLIVKNAPQHLSQEILTSHLHKSTTVADSDVLFVDSLAGAGIDDRLQYETTSLADSMLEAAEANSRREIEESESGKIMLEDDLTSHSDSQPLSTDNLLATALIDSDSEIHRKESKDRASENCATVFYDKNTNNTVAVGDNDNKIVICPSSVRKSKRIARRRFVEPYLPRKRLLNETTYNTEAFWCNDCQVSYVDGCYMHKVQMISDKAVLTRAWASLPPTLQIYRIVSSEKEHSESGELGVFSKRVLSKRSCFGPFIADVVSQLPENYAGFPLQVQLDGEDVWLDASDEDKCNWMMFVRPAQNTAEQNMVAFQHGQYIYFMTTRTIMPRNELKVWYASHYALRYGFSVYSLETEQSNNEENEDGDRSWHCYECSRTFSSPAELQQHLTEHDEEPLVEENIDNDGESAVKKPVKRSRGRPRKSPSQKPSVVEKEGESSSLLNNQFQSWKKVKTNLYLSRLKALRSKGSSALLSSVDENGRVSQSCSVTNPHTQVDCNIKNDKIETEYFDTSANSPEQSHSAASWSCGTCSTVYFSEADLQAHMNSSHAGEMQHENFSGPSEVANATNGVHLQALKTELSFKQYTRRTSVLHRPSYVRRKAVCQICKRKFSSNTARLAHERKAHDRTQVHNKRRCQLCYMCFPTCELLEAHIKQNHSVGDLFKCTQCEKLFADISSAWLHLRYSHPVRRYECMDCHCIFNRIDKLRLHQLKHTSDRQFMCESCGKQFKRKDKLKDHMKRMHAPDRAKRLKRHFREYGAGKKFVPKVLPTDYHRFIYKCQDCKLGFKRRGMLVNHLAKRHPEISTTHVPELNLPILKSQRDYYCQYCDKVYKSSTKRKLHIIKNHPGLQLPACARRRAEWEDVNTGIQNPSFSQTTGCVPTVPHSCEHCHKQYASKAKLFQHQRLKHPTVAPPMPHKRKSYREMKVPQPQQTQSIMLQEPLIDSQMSMLNMEGTDSDGLQFVTFPTGNSQNLRNLMESQQGCDLLTQAMSELQSYTDYRLSDTPGRMLQHPTIDLGPTLTQVQFPSAAIQHHLQAVEGATAVLQSIPSAVFPPSLALVTSQQPDGSTTALNLTRIFLPQNWGNTFQ